MKTGIVYNMHHDNRYEPLKATIEQSAFIRNNHGLFSIHNDKFYLVSFKTIYDECEFYYLLGTIESKYGQLNIVNILRERDTQV